MFSEEALRELPAFRQDAAALEAGMYPVHGNLAAAVFDAVPGLRIVAYNLAGADAALDVDLVEDGVPGLGDAQPVGLHQVLYDIIREEGVEEGNQVGFRA